jgi:hypothetical protein
MASNIEFEYINEDSINHSLKCSICNQPFVRPVSTNCKKRHKFCRHCIEEWLRRSPSCPICRQKLNADDLVSITEDIVVDVLNELRVKCTGCGQTGIERGDFSNHVNNSCPVVTVRCPAEDIKCPWIGHRSRLSSHLKKCSFQSLRPLIVPLVNENQELKEHVIQLTNHIKECQHELQQLRERVNQQATKIDGQHNEILQFQSQSKQNHTQMGSLKSPMMSKCIT